MFQPEDYLIAFANLLLHKNDNNNYSDYSTPASIIKSYDWSVYEAMYDTINDKDFTLYDMLLTNCEDIIAHQNSSTRGKLTKLISRVGADFINMTSLNTDPALREDGKITTIAKTAIGFILINPLLDGNNRLKLLALDLHIIGKNAREYKVRFLEESYIKLSEERHAILYNKRLPQDTPPPDWTILSSKGMVKSATVSSEASEESCMANNILQNTAWRVNHRIHNLIKFHGRIGRDSQSSLKRDLYKEYKALRDTLNEKYFDQGLKVPAEEYGPFAELREHFRDTRDSLSGRDASFIGLTNVASRFSRTNQFHFTYTNDFRGRIYPNAIYMSPQGSDIEKSIMEFATPVSVGNRERYWQEWNLASLIVEADTVEEGCDLALDKLLPDERVQWVKKNWGKLVEIAKEPNINIQWHKWEKPYLAMAQLLEMVFEPHETRQPIAIDATCSGLQFLAAMGKDKQVGKAVNLTKSRIREDVYLFVADKIRVSLAGHPFWGNALFTRNIWRKLVKRCVMVFGYAGTRYGMGDIVFADGKDLLKKKFLGNSEVSNLSRKNAVTLGNLIYDSLPEILPKPEAIMRFLTVATARLIASKRSEGITDPKELALKWHTPSGFKVYQYSEKYNTTSMQYAFGSPVNINELKHGKVVNTMEQAAIRLSIARPEDITFYPAGMSSSAAPNFVHSYDAALAVKTIIAMNLNKPLVRASFCHDSFGTSADRVDELNEVVRKQFVRMFDVPVSAIVIFAKANGIDRDLFNMTDTEKRKCVMKGGDLQEEQAGLHAIYDSAIAQGDLCLKEVLENPFFFS